MPPPPRQLMDQLEELDEGLFIDEADHPVPTAKATLVRSVPLLDHLDDGLVVEADDADDDALTFFAPERAPGSPEPLEAPPITFLLLMVLVGATAAALTFHRQVAQLFSAP